MGMQSLIEREERMRRAAINEQIAAGEITLADAFAQHTITGYVPHGAAKGLDPNLDVPLAQEVEGKLWQGGCKHGVRLPDEFDHVLSLYPWEQYDLGPNTSRTEVRLYDSLDGLPPAEQLVDLAHDVQRRLGEGQQVLVHCQAGLNRSGLLTGLTLIQMGKRPQEAIDLLREKRSPLVLCNATFERWLLALEQRG